MKVTNKRIIYIILFFICLFGGLSAWHLNTLNAENKSNIKQEETQETQETTTETPLATTENIIEDILEEKEHAIEIEKTEIKKEEYINVWVTTKLNIRQKPNTQSKVMGTYYYGDKIKVTYVNDDWAKIKKSKYYISRKYITEKEISYSIYDAPSNSYFKSYMDYRMITSTISKQYKLQRSSAYTGNYGIRMVNGRYCVAVGSYYTTKIGTYLDIVLENGEVIHAILADCKADKDTDVTNRLHPDGSAVEFVVDCSSLNKAIRNSGDVSTVNNWDSSIDYIKIYNKVEDF